MGNASRIIGATLVGLVLGVFVAQQLLSGYLAPWYQITLPEKISRVVTIQSSDLWVQAENGNVYRCYRVQCQLEHEAPNYPNEYELIRPCNAERSTLSLSTHPPSSIVYCRESANLFSRVAYAQDKNGHLWYWNEFGLNGELFLLGWCSIPIGAILGFTIGLIWSQRRQRTIRTTSDARQQFIATDSPRRRKKVRKVVRP